ncbi:hypothetical protein [uncultured Dermacoccus sp.]|nr:hypothetical protein [uncultured Dermacoccus sp.]
MGETNLRRRARARVVGDVGYSLGGWCASMLTMKHPATFGAAVAYQGYFRPHFDGHLPFQPNAPQARSYDLIALEKTNPVPVSLRLFASDANKVSYPSVKEILTVVKRPTDGTARIAQAAATACRCGPERSRARSTGWHRSSQVSHHAPERRGDEAGKGLT